eukprot:16447285-Heterocapsa_arctica.AAC.1
MGSVGPGGATHPGTNLLYECVATHSHATLALPCPCPSPRLPAGRAQPEGRTAGWLGETTEFEVAVPV